MTFTYKKMYQRIAAVVLVVVMTVTGVFGVFPGGVFFEGLTAKAEDAVVIKYELRSRLSAESTGATYSSNGRVRLRLSQTSGQEVNLKSNITGCEFLQTEDGASYLFLHWEDEYGNVVSTDETLTPDKINATNLVPGKTYIFTAVWYNSYGSDRYLFFTNTKNNSIAYIEKTVSNSQTSMNPKAIISDTYTEVPGTEKQFYAANYNTDKYMLYKWQVDDIDLKDTDYDLSDAGVKTYDLNSNLIKSFRLMSNQPFKSYTYKWRFIKAFFCPTDTNSIKPVYKTSTGGSVETINTNKTQGTTITGDASTSGWFSADGLWEQVYDTTTGYTKTVKAIGSGDYILDYWEIDFGGKTAVLSAESEITPDAEMIKEAYKTAYEVDTVPETLLTPVITAKFKEKPKTYTVTYTKDTSYSGNGTISSASEEFLTDGQNALQGSTATPANNNGFLGWYDENGNLYTTNQTITNEELKGLSNDDHTVYARFVNKNIATLKTNHPEWGYIYYPNTGTDNAYYIENSTVYALSKNSAEKNMRSPLTYNLDLSNDDLGITQNERNDILASLKNTTDILALVTDSGNRISNTVTAKPFDDYAFIRWGASLDTATVYGTTTKVNDYETAGLRLAATEDVTVTAIFAPKYKVTYSTKGNGTINKHDTEFEYDNIDRYNSVYKYVTGAEAVPDEGWHFSHWERLTGSDSYVKVAGASADFNPVTDDNMFDPTTKTNTTYRAVFVQYLPITYEVKKVDGGGGTLNGGVTSITEEKAFDPTNKTLVKTLTGATAVADEYSEFLYWIPAKAFTVIGNTADQQYVDEYTGSDLKSTNFVPTATDALNAYAEDEGEIKFYAVFKEKETISYKAVLLSDMDTENTEAGFVRDNGGNTVTKMLIEDGAVDEVTAVANADYTFIEWVDENGTVVSDDPAFTASGAQVVNGAVYRAVFKENPYIAYEAAENGSITSGGLKEFVSKETFDGATATANTGYTFDGWYVKGHESSGKVSDLAAYAPKLTDQTTVTGRTLQSYIDADGAVTLVARFVAELPIDNYVINYQNTSRTTLTLESDSNKKTSTENDQIQEVQSDLVLIKGAKATANTGYETNIYTWKRNSDNVLVYATGSGETFNPISYIKDGVNSETFVLSRVSTVKDNNPLYYAFLYSNVDGAKFTRSNVDYINKLNQIVDSPAVGNQLIKTSVNVETVNGYGFSGWYYKDKKVAEGRSTSNIKGTSEIVDYLTNTARVINIEGMYDFVHITLTYTHTEGGDITKTSDTVTSMTGNSIGCEALPNEEDNYRFVGWKLLNASADVNGTTVDLTIPAADLGNNAAIVYTPEELVNIIKDLQYNNKGIYDSDPTKINVTIQAVFKNDSSTITYQVGAENKINTSGDQYFGKLLSKVNSKASTTAALEFSHSMGVRNQLVIPMTARPTYGCQFDYWTVTASPIEDFAEETTGYTADLNTDAVKLKDALKASMGLAEEEIEVVGTEVHIKRAVLAADTVFPVGYNYTLKAKFSQAADSYRIDYVSAVAPRADYRYFPSTLTLTDRNGETYTANAVFVRHVDVQDKDVDYTDQPILTEFIKAGDKPVGCTAVGVNDTVDNSKKEFQFVGWSDERENSEVILKYRNHIDPWDSLFVTSSNDENNGKYKIDVNPEKYTKDNVTSYKFAAISRNIQNTYLMYRVNNEQYGSLSNFTHSGKQNVIHNINGGVEQVAATPQSKNTDLYDFAGWVLQGNLLEGHTVSEEPDYKKQNYTFISASGLDNAYTENITDKIGAVPQTTDKYSNESIFYISTMYFYPVMKDSAVLKDTNGVPVLSYYTQNGSPVYTENQAISWYINYVFNQTHSDLFSSDNATKQAELNRINGSGNVTDVLNYAIAYFEPKSPYIAINYKVYNADAEKGFVHEDYTVDTWFRNDSDEISVTGRKPLTTEQINAEIVGTHALTKASDDAVYIFKDWIDDTGAIVSTDPDFRPDDAFLSQVVYRMGGDDKIPYVTSVTGKNVRTLTFYARFEVYTEADVTYAPDDSESIGNSVSVTEETDVNIRYGVNGSQAETVSEAWNVLGWNDSDNSMISYMDDFATDKSGLKKWVLTASPEYQHYKEAWEYYWTEKQAYINDHGSTEGFTMEPPTLETIPYTADFIYDPTTAVTLTKYAQSADRKTNTPLQGAKFAIYRVGDDINALKGIGSTGSYSYQTTGDKLTAEFVTDANGKIVIQDLPLGKYYFKETEAPNGYDKCENVYFELTEDNRLITDITCYDKVAERTLTISKTIDQYYPQFGDATFIFHITSTIDGVNVAYNKTITFDSDAVSGKTAPYTLTETLTVPAGNYTVTELATARYATNEGTHSIDLTMDDGTVGFANELSNYALYSHNATQINEIGHFRIDDYALAVAEETTHNINVSDIAVNLKIDHSEISDYDVSNLSFDPATINNGTDKIGTTYSIKATYTDDEKDIKIENIPFNITVQPAGYIVTFHSIANRVNDDGVEVRGYFNYDTAQKKLVDTVENDKTYLKYEQNTLRYLTDGTKLDTNVYTEPTLFESYLSGGVSNYNFYSYQFSGWIDSNGNSWTADSTGKLNNTLTSDLDLYPTFIRVYKLTYVNNVGNNSATTETQLINSFTITDTTPTRTGFTFAGWSTSSSPGENDVIYRVGDATNGSITINQNTTLYAVWKHNFTLTYNSNYPSDSGLEQEQPRQVSPVTYTYTALTAAAGFTVLSDYEFVGWSTSIDASTVEYAAGDKIETGKDTTLYAIWKKKEETSSGT